MDKISKCPICKSDLSIFLRSTVLEEIIEEKEKFIQRLEKVIEKLLQNNPSDFYIQMTKKNTTAEELPEEW